MKSLFIASIFSILLFFSKNQKPDNCTIYKIECEGDDCSYEYKFLKEEIFGFEFTRGRGTCYVWELLNKTNFSEHNSIQFIKSYYYDYINKEYHRALDEATFVEEEVIPPIVGGSEFYYEIFKALYAANSQTLKYIYACEGQNIVSRVSINISVCDEIHEEKCIIKRKCSDIESPSKENCENSNTSNEELKCIFDENNKRCKEEEKKCLEIDHGATEEICADARTTKENTLCILDEKTNSCKEAIIKDGGKNNKFSFILLIIPLIFLC